MVILNSSFFILFHFIIVSIEIYIKDRAKNLKCLNYNKISCRKLFFANCAVKLAFLKVVCGSYFVPFWHEDYQQSVVGFSFSFTG